MRAYAGRVVDWIPWWARGLLVALVVMGGFLGVVVPLFDNSGPAIAEIDGLLPKTLPVTSPVLDLDIDNTGAVAIAPMTCVQISTSGSATAESVTFQGIDTVSVVDGRACGGQLGEQESISIAIRLHVTSTGPVNLTISPSQGTKSIGTPLVGTVTLIKGS